MTDKNGRRTLGRTGIEVSAIGLGCWPIGGEMSRAGQALGYSGVDDGESLRAIAAAVDHGITLFDTADAYGAGHSERLLGRTLGGRDGVVLATKFGNTIDEETRQLTGSDVSPAYVRRALGASLRRLQREHVDLYQLHTPQVDAQQAADLVELLEDLVAEGLIRFYGVSTDDPDELAPFLAGPHCAAVQAQVNVLDGPAPSVAAARAHGLAVLARSPLAMGLLGGRHSATSRLPADDIRTTQPEWLRWFRDGSPAPEFLERLETVRGELTADGRSLAQGALGWILATDPTVIPLPGFRTVDQVLDTAGAVARGPIAGPRVAAIERSLGR